MQKMGYRALGIISIVLALATGFVYMPISLGLFGANSSKWIEATMDLLKSNYGSTLIYLGLVILLAIVALNALSLIYRTNVAKICFKLSIIIALILPIMFVCTLEFEWAFKFWVENIAKNIKVVAYICMGLSVGLFMIGLIYNFTKTKRANLHHIFESLAMCGLLVIMAYLYNWCGWGYSISNAAKIMGTMIIWLPAYLLLSVPVMFIAANFRAAYD